MMQHYDKMDFVTDISSDEWTTLRQLGDLVTSEATRPCPIEYNLKPAAMTELLAPNTTAFLYQVWQPRITLQKGVGDLFQHFAGTSQQPTAARDEL